MDDLPRPYLIRAFDTGYEIVGPFVSRDSAHKWRKKQEGHPLAPFSFQIVALADPNAPPKVICPEVAAQMERV